MQNDDLKAAGDLVDLIRDLIRQELAKRDTTILCQIREKRDDFHYDVTIVPDNSNVIRNVSNMTRFDLEVGDYVYVYKVNNQLSNCFICYKTGVLK